MSESFEEFKDSFSYGSRNDLSFKFLKKLAPERAAEAFRQILSALGTSFDTGAVAELHDLIVAWQEEAYAPGPDDARSYVYDSGPFAPLAKPLQEARIGLLSSSGHFLAGDDPEPFGVTDMTQLDATERIVDFMRATPVLSEIPSDFDRADIRVRHGGYDIRSAVIDHNVVLPRDALAEAEAAGHIGSLAANLYSFPGATSQRRLLREAIPGWVELFDSAAIDVLLLVPV